MDGKIVKYINNFLWYQRCMTSHGEDALDYEMQCLSAHC